jgi:hypothetical protein
MVRRWIGYYVVMILSAQNIALDGLVFRPTHSLHGRDMVFGHDGF